MYYYPRSFLILIIEKIILNRVHQLLFRILNDTKMVKNNQKVPHKETSNKNVNYVPYRVENRIIQGHY